MKASVGFGDRLQALSHALHYALKYQRILCVDWSDAIWPDGSVNFNTFFDVCGIKTVAPDELYSTESTSIAPDGWLNQLDRPASTTFLYRTPYLNSLPDEENSAEILVYGSTGHRVFYRDNLNLLRVKRPFRQAIIDELIRYRDYQVVVHLRGTDRVGPDDYDRYLAQTTERMQGVAPNEPLLVVSDCLPLFERLKLSFPNAVLRTPNLESFNLSQGTHFQTAIQKRDYNLQMLIDFFLLVYAPNCIWDGQSTFSKMARFLRDGYHADILGYDR